MKEQEEKIEEMEEMEKAEEDEEAERERTSRSCVRTIGSSLAEVRRPSLIRKLFMVTG